MIKWKKQGKPLKGTQEKGQDMMKAVVFNGVGDVTLTERPKPRLLEKSDALVRVTLTTICSSDIHIKHGAVPRAVPGTVLGHEFVGVVEQVGEQAMGESRPGDTVAVIGAGPTGLCAMMCARLYGPGQIVAVDVDPFRLELARSHGLADVVYNPAACDLKAQIQALTGGRGADCVLECAGGRDTFRTAWEIARPNAVVGVIAMYEEAQTLPLPEMYGKNLVFKTGGVDGCRCGEIMELIRQGKLDTGCLITHRTDLDHIMEAYRVFEEKRDHVVKYAVRV